MKVEVGSEAQKGQKALPRENVRWRVLHAMSLGGAGRVVHCVSPALSASVCMY
jgi:hypothetical protein